MSDNRNIEEKEKMEEQMRQYMEYVNNLMENLPLPIVADAGEMEEKMLPSHDGVRLRTWFFFPQNAEGPFPTVAVRCCYDNNEPMLLKKAEAFNKRGFGFAVQWCRGTHGSEGEWVPNINERDDGLSFMNYLQNDERVENVGYWGDSYLALTGWCMADVVPSKVKTMYLGVYGCFRHVSAYKDGLFRQDILTSWAMENAGVPVTADYLQSAAYKPQAEVDEAMWGVRLDWYRDWITHTDRVDPYWDEGFWGMMKEIPSKVKIPLYIREGWYDHHLGSALCTWEALSEETKSISTLEIGPWNHFYMPCIEHQSIDNLEDTSMSAPLMWFDRILRKKETPESKVRLYEIGADRWEEGTQFPVPVQDKIRFYLSCGEENSLKTGKDSESSFTGYEYDPENPLMSKGTESCLHSIVENGSHRMEKAGYRDDVISFYSEPLTEDIHVNGEIEVDLYVSSDAEDTAFTAKVMESFAEGEDYNIRGSITTLAYRNDTPVRLDYNRNEIVPVTIKTWAVDWLFKKGSRIRLDISSSDFPEYSVHTNHAGVWALQGDSITARQKIYAGGDTPSSVILPIAP